MMVWELWIGGIELSFLVEVYDGVCLFVCSWGGVGVVGYKFRGEMELPVRGSATVM